MELPISVTRNGIRDADSGEWIVEPVEKYRVLDDYIDQWYGNADDEDIEEKQEEGWTEEEVEKLAQKWGKSYDELMEQLEEI